MLREAETFFPKAIFSDVESVGSAFFLSCFLKFFILFIWLCRVLVVARRMLSCTRQTLSCGVWDLVS